MSTPTQDDPDGGEFSNVGRDGWDWECVFWFALLIVVAYGPIVWAVRGCER
jgi:hypothetical protein